METFNTPPTCRRKSRTASLSGGSEGEDETPRRRSGGSLPRSGRAESGGSSSKAPLSERQQLNILKQISGESDPNGPGVCQVTPKTTRGERRNVRGETPLHVACINGDYELVKRLIEKGFSVNTVDNAGWTPLHEACNRGWYKVARLLIASGANINAQGSINKFTPLHDAAVNSHHQIVKLLLRYGADPEAKTADGKTALQVSSLPKISDAISNYNGEEDSPGTPLTPNFACRRGVLKPASLDFDFNDLSLKKNPRIEAMSTPTPETKKVHEDLTPENSPKPTSREESPAKTVASSTIAANEDIEGDESSTKSEPVPETSESSPQAEDDVQQSTENTAAKASEDQESADDQKSHALKKRRRSVEKEVSPAPSDKQGDKKSELMKAAARSPKAKKPKGRPEKSSGGTSHSDSEKTVDKTLDARQNDKSNSSCSDAENQDKDSTSGDGLKVPPLKIVLPPMTGEKECSNDVPVVPVGTKGKQLPYIVNSPLAGNSPQPASPASNSPLETKEQREESKRVTRSSQRANQQHDNEDQSEEATSSGGGKTHPRKRKIRNTRTAAAAANQRESNRTISTSSTEKASIPVNDEEMTEIVPAPEKDYFGEPSTMFNPYQALKNIRQAVEKRRVAQINADINPEVPINFEEFMINKCSYALESNASSRSSVSRASPPNGLTVPLKQLFHEQEDQRYRLKLQHLMEREKLVLSCEQEIVRVNAQSARASAGQTIPLSVTTVLRDLEIYNTLDPESNLYNPRTGMTAINPLLENDKKDRSRYNGRVFTSLLQDVEDKWERNKEAMLLRHHSEAESLRAVQKMDWEWKSKAQIEKKDRSVPGEQQENSCDLDISICVPMVDVNDELNILPS